MVNGLSSRTRGAATGWDTAPAEKGSTHLDVAEDNKPNDIVLIILSEGVPEARPMTIEGDTWPNDLGPSMRQDWRAWRFKGAFDTRFYKLGHCLPPQIEYQERPRKKELEKKHWAKKYRVRKTIRDAGRTSDAPKSIWTGKNRIIREIKCGGHSRQSQNLSL